LSAVIFSLDLIANTTGEVIFAFLSCDSPRHGGPFRVLAAFKRTGPVVRKW
jgi:hypothetical protein